MHFYQAYLFNRKFTLLNDRRFVYQISLTANSFLVFDNASNLYSQFKKWIKQKIWFVTRMKENAVYQITKVPVDSSKRRMPKVL